MRITFEEMKRTFARILVSRGFGEQEAADTAAVFAENSLDGVYSHGYLRFPRIMEAVERGGILPNTAAECVMSFGAMERWEGKRALGPLNARRAMDRACDLAQQYGIGLVALGNSSHWLRGGSYGWQAANRGFIGICWSNTMPNMPAWGAKDCRIGNTPVIFAVPRSSGAHVVADLALSQFSYGKLQQTRLAGEQLPVPGGYDEEGSLTTDPGAIEKSRRVLPAGYWKGSAMSIVLELIGTVLSGGNSVQTVGTLGGDVGLTQIMIAVDPLRFGTQEENDRAAEQLIRNLKDSVPVREGGEIRYPAEREYKTRQENLKFGIPVNEAVWKQIVEY